MDYQSVRERLSDLIQTGHLKEAKEMIDRNEGDLQYDWDFQNIKAVYYYIKNELKEAEDILELCVQKVPFNFEMCFNLGMVYESASKRVKAFNTYYKASSLADKEEEKVLCKEKINNLIEVMGNENNVKELNECREIAKFRAQEYGNHYTMFPYTGSTSKVGKKIEDTFIGIYDQTNIERDGKSIPKDEIYLNKYEMYKLSQDAYSPLKEEAIVPIVALEENSQVVIEGRTIPEVFTIKNSERYYYYKLREGEFVKKNNNILSGKPISCIKKQGLKDLVLVLFVDGLSQSILDEYGDDVLMPNTYRFFKQGVVNTNTYVSGEWTYVSLASFFTGKYTVNHNMFHPEKNTKLPLDHLILSEVFQEQGYMTAKIDGDWRSNFAYGYGRGFDRILYQPCVRGMDAPDIVKELVEHMEAFKDTNQFVWTCIPDLHDIADGYHLPISVQAHEELNEKNSSVNYIQGKTSVRQGHSLTKKELYLKQLKRIDTYLGMLYTYIESNFNMDNVVISLIADHGQGYLIPEGKHSMRKERVKVPLMVRGGVAPARTDELIQGLDLMSILYKQCSIQQDLTHLDTNLPKCFGGKKERSYTYSEMLFPQSSYKVSIHMKDYVAYFETEESVKEDGRVKLEPYTLYIEKNNTGERINDKALEEKVFNIIYEHMKEHRIY